jgi:hypothetical protein
VATSFIVTNLPTGGEGFDTVPGRGDLRLSNPLVAGPSPPYF